MVDCKLSRSKYTQLSGKIVNLYQLASRQLSQQDYYDFGMRAIKSVLVMAGHGRLQAQQK